MRATRDRLMKQELEEGFPGIDGTIQFKAYPGMGQKLTDRNKGLAGNHLGMSAGI